MSRSFESQFKDFYIKMQILNHKILEGEPLNEDYKKIKTYMGIIIPIFDRLLSNSTVFEKSSLKDILGNYSGSSSASDSVELYEVNTIPENIPETIPKTIPKIVDEVGDNAVHDLNVKSYELLQEYRKLNWLYIK